MHTSDIGWEDFHVSLQLQEPFWFSQIFSPSLSLSLTYPGLVLVEEDLVAVLALDVSDPEVLGVDVAPEVVGLHKAVAAVLAQVGAAASISGEKENKIVVVTRSHV